MNAQTLINTARTNPALAAALTVVPEWQQTIDLRDAVQQKMDNLAHVPLPPRPTNADQLDDWIAAAAAATSQQEQAERLHATLRSLAADLTGNLDGTAWIHGNTMLADLHTQLVAVMKSVATIADKLNGANNASAAITQQVEKHWRALPELRIQYENIRAAQTIITIAVDSNASQNAISPHLPEELASDLLLANMDELIPGWRIADTRWVASGNPPRRAPWPTEPIEQLVWLATSDAQPWVPTTDQLAQLNDKRLNRPPMNIKPLIVHGRTDRKATTNA